MKRLFACLYAPLFWLGFIGLAAWLVETRDIALYWLIPVLLVAIALSFFAEAWLPYDPTWNRSHGDRLRDIAHGLVNESSNALSIAAVPLIAALMPFPGAWPDRWPFVLQLFMAIVVADCGITLAHYLSHRWNWLWRFHAVHHGVTRMYGFNGLMKHPLHQAVEAAAGTTPLLLLGMPVSIAAVLAFAIAIQLLLQHSNVDMKLGLLRHVFAWAPVHRFHHLKYGRAGNVNFGLFFTVWDRLLGTAFDAPKYRMRSVDLGIGGRPDYPRSYVQQLVEPFRSSHMSYPASQLPEGLAGTRS